MFLVIFNGVQLFKWETSRLHIMREVAQLLSETVLANKDT
jgi:hypothetical protein